MKLRWWQWIWPWPVLIEIRRRAKSAVTPLRQFVYLDEVALRSLLSSKVGELKESISRQLTRASQAELSLSTDSLAGVAKLGAGGKIGASASRSTQTTLKALAQSLFRDFYLLSESERLLTVGVSEKLYGSVDAAISSGALVPVTKLLRGSLFEVEVELKTDGIYEFSALITEISDMSERYPEMLRTPGLADVIEQSGPILRVLQQLSVGLIPIRAEVLSHRLANIDGRSYVVPTAVAESLNLETTRLDVAGESDSASYWQDVRRVLFSGGRFAMLCRLSIDGLHEDWNALKGGDLLTQMVPDFARMMSSVGRTKLAAPTENAKSLQEESMVAALTIYLKLLRDEGVAIDELPSSALDTLIEGQRSRSSTAEGQRQAFRLIEDYAMPASADSVTFERRRELRQLAREQSGLDPFLQVRADRMPKHAAQVQPIGDERLVEAEIIAIYW